MLALLIKLPIYALDSGVACLVPTPVLDGFIIVVWVFFSKHDLLSIENSDGILIWEEIAESLDLKHHGKGVGRGRVSSNQRWLP